MNVHVKETEKKRRNGLRSERKKGRVTRCEQLLTRERERLRERD